MMGIKIILIL